MDKIKKIKIIMGLIYLVILSIFLYFLFDNFNFEDISSIKVIQFNQDRLNMLKENNLILLISIFFLLTVLWVLFLGFGSPIALIGGFIFGKWIGTIIVTTSLSIGALCLYIFAKYFLYDLLKENLFTKSFIKKLYYLTKNVPFLKKLTCQPKRAGWHPPHNPTLQAQYSFLFPSLPFPSDSNNGQPHPSSPSAFP